MYALNASTGVRIWRFTTGDYITSSPVVVGNIIVIGSDDYMVYALNAYNGSLVWKYETGGDIWSTAATNNNIVYIGSNDNNLYALNATTGDKIWNYDAGGIVESSPALANGVIFVGSDNNAFYALNSTNGTPMWIYKTSGPIESSPAIANGMVFIGSYDHTLYAFEQNVAVLIGTVTADPVNVFSGGASKIKVSVNSNGKPISAATITFTSDKGGNFSALTDYENGTYTSTFTAPDTTIQTTCTITASASKIGYLGTSEQQTQVTVQPLILNIYVKDTSGSPISGATVTSISQPSGQTSLSGVTDSNGLTTFTGILKGSYAIKASKPGLEDNTWTGIVASGQVATQTIMLATPFPWIYIIAIIVAVIIIVVVILVLKRRKSKSTKSKIQNNPQKTN